MMKQLTIRRLLLLLASLLAFALSSSNGYAEPSMLAQAQAEMRARQFEKATALADKAISAKDAASDALLFLKASALFQSKKYSEAVISADQLVKDYPKSDWRYKAVFLKAQSFIEQKKFTDAAVIYESEATRILDPERKQALVGEILNFAEKLEAKADPNVPDSPQPNFAKAYSLYTKALVMELPREFRDEIVFRKARAIQQAGNAAQAIQDFQAYLTEYDPSWTGTAGSGAARLPMQNPPPAGKHVAFARFRLAESLSQAGNPDAARMELEDLLKMISAPAKEATALMAELATDDGKKLTAEIRWLQVNSYFVMGAEMLAKSKNVVGQNTIISSTFNQNTGAFIGNTGGLPTNDAQLYTLANGDLDQALKACREYLAAHPVGSRAVRVA